MNENTDLFFHSCFRQKYPDNETNYMNFGDSLADIPNMIQNQLEMILKNDESNGAGGKFMSKLKKLIKN